MKKYFLPLSFLLVLLVVVFPAKAQSSTSIASTLPQGPQGDPFSTRFTYQGQIKDAAGDPITDACDFRFGLWNSLADGAQIGSDSLVSAVVVEDGHFAALVNAAGEFGADAFVGEPRWLEIGVRCPSGSGDYTTLSPRQILSVTPLASFAFTSAWADSTTWAGISSMPAGFADGVDNNTTYTAGNGLTLSANQFSVSFGGNGSATTAARSDHIHTSYWRINGNSQTDPATNFIGTMDNVALVFKVNNQTALRLEPNATSPNVIGGYSANAVTAGMHGATIGGGGENGAPNRVMAHFGTVGGGLFNIAGDAYSAVGGGWDNQANGDYAIVSGGNGNRASDYAATVAGGGSNQVNGIYGAVNGGFENIAGGDYALVGGGRGNTANNTYTVIGGGQANTASGMYSTIPGGNGAVAPLYGQMSYASGYFDTPGDAQTSLYVVRNTSFNDTWINLYLDGMDDWISIPAGRTVVFDILVVGRSTLLSAAYQIRGVVENVSGSVNLIGTPVVTVLGEDSATWDVTVIASDIFDAWGVQVKGATAGIAVQWVASIQTVEVAAP